MIDSFIRTYEGTDWRSVLHNALVEDFDIFRNKSMLNHCKIGFCGDLTLMPESEQSKYIEDVLNKIKAGSGAIYRTKELGYLVCSTDIQEIDQIPADQNWWMYCARTAEAVLISEHTGQWQIVNTGNFDVIKRKAHSLLRRIKYQHKCYIITHDKCYLCYGKINRYKQTKKITDDKYLVTPYFEFKILGRVNID